MGNSGTDEVESVPIAKRKSPETRAGSVRLHEPVKLDFGHLQQRETTGPPSI